jgi:amino acid adenylation domain-containing protein
MMSNEINSFSNTNELLAYLSKLDVQLKADQGRLSITAPKGVVTPQLQQELKSRKQELLEIIERRSQVEASAAPAGDATSGKCVHELFSAQVAATPHHVAVICGAEHLTYRDLETRSNRLANRLRSTGVGPDVLAGVCLNRSLEMIVALMATLKAGGAYVPMDPALPSERLKFMIEDSGVQVLICCGNFPHTAVPPGTKIIDLEKDWNSIEQESWDCPPNTSTPENLAYVIYTSGSTGIPKGVAVEHHSVVNFLESMRAEPGISESDRLLAVTTLSFDIAGLEMYLPLTVGARVVILPQEALGDGAALQQLLKDSEATMMQATPITWRLLLESGWDGLPQIKILCGGEALPRELANRLIATGCEVWNLYGPTETTIWSTIHRVEPGDGAVPIGKPIARTQLYILDERQNPVPPGIAGELYIGGAGVAREYWKRPELTAARFLTDPYRKGNRMYRTGDLVRRLPNRALEHLGRNDRQVKLRGFRIELGEIEIALEQQPGVRQAIVELREFGPGDYRLTAYLVATEAGSASELRRALAVNLPEYMIPAAFVFLDAFPLTPNNKIDRNALPAPGEHEPAPSTAIVTGNSNTANQLAAIWRGLFKTSEIGLDDDFFALGGHSLLILQLQILIRRQLSYNVSIPDLFQRPTIASLAELLDSKVASLAPPLSQNPSSASADPQPAGPFATNERVAENRAAHNRNGAGSELSVAMPRAISGADSVGDGGDHSPRRLVPGRLRGSRVPLFLVAGFQSPDDTLMVMSRLLPHLSTDQPLYGLKPRWVDGGELYSCVEEEAREYIAEVRSAQAHGPYLLGGYCLGGVVAFEMARQLMAEGEQIGLLALIDSERPTKARTVAANIVIGIERAQRIASSLRDAVRFNDPSRSGPARNRIRRKFGMGRPETEEIIREKLYVDCKVRYQQIIREYEPKEYPGRVTLLVSEQAYRLDRAKGWDRIPIGELVIEKLSGDHLTMFTEHGKELAALLTESIKAAAIENGQKTECVEVSAS